MKPITFLFLSLIFLFSCKRDSNIIEVPVDSSLLVPQWRSNPIFFLNDKYQWSSYTDGQELWVMGNSRVRKLHKNGRIISSAWESFSYFGHQNPNFQPILTPKYSVVQYLNEGSIAIVSNERPNIQTFFSLGAQSETEGFFFPWRRVLSQLPSIGAVYDTGQDTFQVVLFAYDKYEKLGLLTVDCHFPELGNPRASFSGFYEFPVDSQYTANPGFIFAMGNSLLTFIKSNDPGPSYGELLYQWSPQTGFKIYDTFPWTRGSLLTGFPARDGKSAWIMADNGKLYRTEGINATQLVYDQSFDSNHHQGKELEDYIAVFSNIELFLIHKESGAILVPANYGLDGHVISDFTVFKDTAFISSQTGGLFYKAWNEVLP